MGQEMLKLEQRSLGIFDCLPMRYNKSKNLFFNEDCIEGAKRHLQTSSVDLIVTDPPYGIDGGNLHRHYNRNESFVVDGYVEIPKEKYAEFSKNWVREAERILRPGGSMYIVSGYTNLPDILNALRSTSLKEVNHIIWKYNFGVHTSQKYVSSHYHILYYEKPGGKRTFNTHTRFGQTEKDGSGSLNYKDREDVWIINREYQPGKIKNKNQLPKALLTKMLQYSSNEGDIVCDFFLGSFSTAEVAIGLNRYAVGFELNKKMFDHSKKKVFEVKPGHLLSTLRKPLGRKIENYGKSWTKEEIQKTRDLFKNKYARSKNKRKTIEEIASELGRGYFSVLNILDKNSFQTNR